MYDMIKTSESFTYICPACGWVNNIIPGNKPHCFKCGLTEKGENLPSLEFDKGWRDTTAGQPF